MPGVGGAGSRLLRTFAPCLQPNEPRATASGAGDAQQVTESPQNQGGFLRARDVASRMRFAPAGRAQSSHRIDPTRLGFGPEVDRLVHKSPTLTAQLRSARAAGYRVSAGTPGEGSYLDPATQSIVVDPGQTRDEIVSSIAHEVGHAMHVIHGFVPSTTSEKSYCDDKAWDEGGAMLNEYKIRDELRRGGENFSPQNIASLDEFFLPIYESFNLGTAIECIQVRCF
jgi:hypothetical protein